MNDHADTIRRCIHGDPPFAYLTQLEDEADQALDALVAERDKLRATVQRMAETRVYFDDRTKKAEAESQRLRDVLRELLVQLDRESLTDAGWQKVAQAGAALAGVSDGDTT